MNTSAYINTRRSLVFGLTTAGIAGLGTLCAFVLSLTVSAFAGAICLGVFCCTLGILRALWPGRPWFSGRSRPTDAIAYIGVGVLLFVFAPLANTIVA